VYLHFFRLNFRFWCFSKAATQPGARVSSIGPQIERIRKKTFIRKRFLSAPVIALVKPRDNDTSAARRFLPVISLPSASRARELSMLETVVILPDPL